MTFRPQSIRSMRTGSTGEFVTVHGRKCRELWRIATPRLWVGEDFYLLESARPPEQYLDREISIFPVYLPMRVGPTTLQSYKTLADAIQLAYRGDFLPGGIAESGSNDVSRERCRYSCCCNQDEAVLIRAAFGLL